ncbi:HAD-IIIC family phosphatase [Streptomyces decoyicus]|uniref:HAD-IIIC family phosphatase n=1 Tax=Streptomyces decoyicus TaxID=249567 RepID=UPI0033A46848
MASAQPRSAGPHGAARRRRIGPRGTPRPGARTRNGRSPARVRRSRLYRRCPAVAGPGWAQALRAFSGLSRKVLVLDLDNTLWGGTLGELGPSGIEIGGLYPGNSYTELQEAALRLRNQGVVLGLASKNDEALVMKVLQEHPEVVLRPDTFSTHAVNWGPKPDSIRTMADALNLPPSALVFMDDSPFELAHVEEELPDVATVPPTGDPADLARRLLSHGWFDVLELTDADQRPPELYRARHRRQEFETEQASSHAFLHGLGLCVRVARAGEYDLGRVAQLSARTDQFNLKAERLDLARTARMDADPGFAVLVCSVSDRFGDEGLVGALWVERSTAVHGG